MNNDEKIDSLSPGQVSQVLEWFAADMLDEAGFSDLLPEDVGVVLPQEALDQDAVSLAKKFLQKTVNTRQKQVEDYLEDCASVRGLLSSDLVSPLFHLALALYLSLEFKCEIVKHEEDGKVKKKKTTFAIKSRTLTETLRKLLE